MRREILFRNFDRKSSAEVRLVKTFSSKLSSFCEEIVFFSSHFWLDLIYAFPGSPNFVFIYILNKYFLCSLFSIFFGTYTQKILYSFLKMTLEPNKNIKIVSKILILPHSQTSFLNENGSIYLREPNKITKYKKKWFSQNKYF